jgi:hypothetical protein
MAETMRGAAHRGEPTATVRSLTALTGGSHELRPDSAGVMQPRLLVRATSIIDSTASDYGERIVQIETQRKGTAASAELGARHDRRDRGRLANRDR